MICIYIDDSAVMHFLGVDLVVSLLMGYQSSYVSSQQEETINIL